MGRNDRRERRLVICLKCLVVPCYNLFMQKDFDEWNGLKKVIHDKTVTPSAHEREVWWMSFGLNIGVETDGKHKSFERPALVLRKFNREMLWILPITSRAKDDRFHQKFIFDGKTFWVMLTQIRTISGKRLLRKIGTLPKLDFESIQSRIVSFVRKNENSP